jgi:hypothetical protein
MGNEKYCPDGPRVEVVVQDEEIRGSVFEDGSLHFGVSGVDNSGTERSRLTFQLKRRITRWADVVDRGGALWRGAKAGGFASGAEETRGTPGFGADAGTLRSAFVAVETGGGKMQVHAGIRSWSAALKKGDDLGAAGQRYSPKGDGVRQAAVAGLKPGVYSLVQAR